MLFDDFKQAKQHIEAAHHILLTTHERTDGDDFGTISALASLIKQMGKQTTMVVRGGIPKNLHFIQGSETVTENLPKQNYDLLIVSGCSNKERIGNPELIELNIPTINLDHHRDNTNYGTVNIVDPEASSVAELTFRFINWCNWNITKPIATALLAGIITDTGSLMHSNTAAQTLRTTATLLKKGTHTHTIIKHTFKGKEPRVLRAWGKAMDNARLNTNKGCISAALSAEDFHQLDNIPQSAFEGFVETLNKTKQALFALFLKQDQDQIKCSLRSESYKGIDVGQLARLLGGGGHKLASGFVLKGKLVKQNNNWEIHDN